MICDNFATSENKNFFFFDYAKKLSYKIIFNCLFSNFLLFFQIRFCNFFYVFVFV